ncbi:MAG: hypothetical protein CL944_02100 [Candidatus Diapherotrites archaeon]|uniref:Uncharacterized protein n=1 Tax=Candidatus Iainarchaeum sp. TaxID=3101447 RepID=A0A2D6LQ52_9ARCH|nr:hypothetical protein [Candidatus Diapherotrites archaeon]|tara:strand:+ start:2459 stop:2818 length:360 start_codon:yes stop_codon:yes gene_type:complete
MSKRNPRAIRDTLLYWQSKRGSGKSGDSLPLIQAVQRYDKIQGPLTRIERHVLTGLIFQIAYRANEREIQSLIRNKKLLFGDRYDEREYSEGQTKKHFESLRSKLKHKDELKFPKKKKL